MAFHEHTQLLSFLAQWNPFHRRQKSSTSSSITIAKGLVAYHHPLHQCAAKSQETFQYLPNKNQTLPTSSLAAQVFIRGQTSVVFGQQRIPELAPGELLVQLSHSGVCGTDFATYSGALGEADGVIGFVTPHIGGHEGIGTIIAAGSAIETNDFLLGARRLDVEKFEIGQRVGIRWMSKTCEECRYCRLGRGDLCAFQRMTSVHEHGTFQQFCRVHSSDAVRIPETVGAGNAAAMMCAGSAAHAAVKVNLI